MRVLLIFIPWLCAASDVPLTMGATPADWKNAELWCAPAGTAPPVSFTAMLRMDEQFRKTKASQFDIPEASSSAPAVYHEPVWPDAVSFALPVWYPARPECKGAPGLILAAAKTTAVGHKVTRTRLVIHNQDRATAP